MNEDYPASQLEPEKLKAVQYSLLAAYGDIPEKGPQVCFDSVQWLKEVVPILRSW